MKSISKDRLVGKTLGELKVIVARYGLPSFTSKQIAEWVYNKRVGSIEEMTNLSKKARKVLEADFEVGILEYVDRQVSKDGTKKYLFRVGERDGSKKKDLFIESVMIPDRSNVDERERETICVSSQAGCRMGCKFCMTGRGGLKGNLAAADIVGQFLSIDEADSLTNAVFMGMGEPLDNTDEVLKAMEVLTADWGFAWSPRRITLSTIGVIPEMVRFLDESKCHLAVSLHNPFHQERLEMMPVENKYPIEEVLQVIRRYDFSGQRRVSFEYIMFEGVNDTKRHADGLIRLLRGLECRVNLIRYHELPEQDRAQETAQRLKPSSLPVIEAFKDRLNNAGITTTLRASRGEDIMAACGLLAGK